MPLALQGDISEFTRLYVEAYMLLVNAAAVVLCNFWHQADLDWSERSDTRPDEQNHAFASRQNPRQIAAVRAAPAGGSEKINKNNFR